MYVVKKPIYIGGRLRAAGELLQDAEVTSGTLVRGGYVVKVTAAIANPGEDDKDGSIEVIEERKGVILVELPVLTELPVLDGDVTSVSMATDSIVEGVRIMQLKPQDAIAAIKTSADYDMCVFLTLCDTTKAVKAAAQSRAEAIAKAMKEDGGEA